MYVCEDALGIETYSTQWAEWMVTVPLLGYVTLAVEDKRSLTNEDKLAVVSMFLMIFFGFAMNFLKDSPVYGWTLFVLSALCYGSLIRMLLRSRARALLAHILEEANTSWKVERSSMKYRLTRMLVIMMPLFPLVYILKYSGAINR
jgi:uncharacterized membrane protein YbaN (DUF454 family)